MASNLFQPPANYELPLSKGGDLNVAFLNNPSGDGVTFTNWGAGVSVTLVIDTVPSMSVSATITGDSAAVWLASASCDLVHEGALWRLLVDIPGTPTVQIVAANGKVARFDGS